MLGFLHGGPSGCWWMGVKVVGPACWSGACCCGGRVCMPGTAGAWGSPTGAIMGAVMGAGGVKWSGIWRPKTEHVFFKSSQMHVRYKQEDLQANPPSSFCQLCWEWGGRSSRSEVLKQNKTDLLSLDFKTFQPAAPLRGSCQVDLKFILKMYSIDPLWFITTHWSQAGS